MQINQDTLFVLQLLGFIGAGGFIGEFYRTTYSGSIIGKHFIANFLAGSFLAFMLSFGFYLISNNRNLSLILGGLLSYQDEKHLSRVAKRFANQLLKGDRSDENLDEN